MERFCFPNLPKSKVKRVFVSQLMPNSLISELNDMGIITYKLGRSENIYSELGYHPDILLNNYLTGQWICEYNAKYIPKEIPRHIIIESELELGDLYPCDCLFNNFSLHKALVCGKSTDYLIKSHAKYEEHRIIFVPQSYTKCCCIPITNSAVITCDRSIGKKLRENGFDVLTIEDSNEIGLRGYSHGLIGGCAGMISENLLAFTGDLNKYKYGNDIRDFCDNFNVDAFSLTNNPMYDYGGILPITEVIDNTEVSERDYAMAMFIQKHFPVL